MLAMPFEEKRLAKWKPPYLVQPKLDGERCRALIGASGATTLLSSEETMILSVPHIIQALDKLNLRNIEFDGELYTHGMQFDDIHSRVSRKVNLHDDHFQIEYHIFDIIEGGIPQHLRAKILEQKREMFRPPLRLVSCWICHSLDDILQAYDWILEQGYEGIIVRQADALYERKRSLWVMKFKPRKDDIYEITGTKMEMDIKGNPKHSLGALECRGSDGTIFSVGSGFTAQQRSELWLQRSTLPGRFVRVKYQHINESGAPRFPIFSELYTIKRA